MNIDISTGKHNRTVPTIGVFIGIYGGYQEELWSGISQVASAYQANAVCFAGGAVDDGDIFRQYWNAIYGMAGPANIDGLILFTNPLKHYVSVEKVTPLLQAL